MTLDEDSNDRYIQDVILQILKNSKEPIFEKPPNIQQMSLIVDRNIEKKEKVEIEFDGFFMAPRSSKVNGAIESLLFDYPPVIHLETMRTKESAVPKKIIDAHEKPYFRTGERPPTIFEPFLIVIEKAFQTSKYMSDSLTGGRNLPPEYLLAEIELEEKFLGKKGLEQMNEEIKKCLQLSERELYTQSHKIYFEEHPDVLKETVSVKSSR